MRLFKIKNSRGQEYDLNDLENFFHDPSGLGFKRDTDYLKIGNRYIPQDDKFSQPEISGTIRFKGSEGEAYDKYYEFAKFIQHVPLTLYYTPDLTYRIDVYVESIDKTEIDKKSDGLDCKIKFSGTNLFYRDVIISNDGKAAGKVYPYRYNYTYNDFIPGTAAIESDSAEDSPCRIFIYGKAVNPHWYHYLNGKLVGEGKVNATIASGDKLVVDSMSMPYLIRETDSDNKLIHDRYQQSDFTMSRFIFLGYGHNLISVGHDGTDILKVALEAMILHETV